MADGARAAGDAAPKKDVLETIDLATGKFPLRALDTSDQAGQLNNTKTGGKRVDNWTSPWFSLPEAFQLKQVVCQVGVTETSTQPLVYDYLNKTGFDALASAIKNAVSSPSKKAVEP